jgi:hypothetical protein
VALFLPLANTSGSNYRSKANFWHIYRPLAVRWFIYHNSATDAPSQIAFGTRNSGVFENETYPPFS